MFVRRVFRPWLLRVREGDTTIYLDHLIDGITQARQLVDSLDQGLRPVAEQLLSDLEKTYVDGKFDPERHDCRYTLELIDKFINLWPDIRYNLRRFD